MCFLGMINYCRVWVLYDAFYMGKLSAKKAALKPYTEAQIHLKEDRTTDKDLLQ